MCRSPALTLSMVLLLLAQAVSPALAVGLQGPAGVRAEVPGGAGLAGIPDRVGLAGAVSGQDQSIQPLGQWIILCTAAGLRRVFFTAEGQIFDRVPEPPQAGEWDGSDRKENSLDGSSGDDGKATRPAGHRPLGAHSALICPLSILAALLLPPPPLLSAPVAYGQPVDLVAVAAVTVPQTRAFGPPLGARGPPLSAAQSADLQRTR